MNKRIVSIGAGLMMVMTLLSGCGEDGYRPSAVILPNHIRNITLRPFTNRTQFFGLEEKLWLAVSREFIRDGRLPYVNDEKEADGIVIGEITRYIKEPISYDVNHVAEEYKIWILITLKFYDRANNVALWEEPNMEQIYRYFVETKPGGMTEEEAREIVWDLFARDIVKRTIDGFGTVMGASERRISSEKPKPAKKPFQVPPSPY
ncbi:MAG TPA: LptE family protein [Elusimicrobiota bacterium]|nr:LptE family protein [Elusimicrobiota bacterium]